MGPVTPTAPGGTTFVAKFTDNYSRMAIFLPKTRRETNETFHLYNTTVAAPLRQCAQRQRSDKGREFMSKGCRQLSFSSGIAMEYTAAVGPQQNGVSSLTGQALSIMVRCMRKDCNFPDNVWGELFLTAVYISNRSPHAARGGATPSYHMHDKKADMTGLRAIRPRVSVHTETYTTKLKDKAFEGNVCGFIPNSRAYRICNPENGTMVKTRNVTLMECWAYAQPTGTGHIDYLDDEDATYVRDTVDYKTPDDSRDSRNNAGRNETSPRRALENWQTGGGQDRRIIGRSRTYYTIRDNN